MGDLQQPFGLDGQHESSMDNTLPAEHDHEKLKKKSNKKRKNKKKAMNGEVGGAAAEEHAESNMAQAISAIGEELHELEQAKTQSVHDHPEQDEQVAMGGPVQAPQPKKRKKNKKKKNKDGAGGSAMNGHGESDLTGEESAVVQEVHASQHNKSPLTNGHSKLEEQVTAGGQVLALRVKLSDITAISKSPTKRGITAGVAYSDTSDATAERAQPNGHTPSPTKAQNTQESDSKTTTTPEHRHTDEEWTDPATIDDEWDLKAALEGGLGTPSRGPTHHDSIAKWFHAQTRPCYHALSIRLKDRAIEHLKQVYHPEPSDSDTDWPKKLRHMVWRAVVRANFFWTNPHTGKEGGKPKPVARPAGVFENHFEAFVECAAERLDRIGRDLPNAEYVKTVEDEVRDFLNMVEEAGKEKELEHLAFLLLFDEEQRKTALSLVEMQDRIRRTLGGSDIVWKGLDIMKRGKPLEKGEGSSRSLWSSEGVWEHAKLQGWLNE